MLMGAAESGLFRSALTAKRSDRSGVGDEHLTVCHQIDETHALGDDDMFRHFRPRFRGTLIGNVGMTQARARESVVGGLLFDVIDAVGARIDIGRVGVKAGPAWTA